MSLARRGETLLVLPGADRQGGGFGEPVLSLGRGRESPEGRPEDAGLDDVVGAPRESVVMQVGG